MFIPVIDSDHNPLMPTIPSRARRMIRSKEATPFFRKGVFHIRLNREPSNRKTQPVVVGIDPGSKKEAYTVKSEAHTYLNIQANAVIWVKERMDARRSLRRKRRNRKTPYRQPRLNRASLKKNRIPPSTKARWWWKLRICRQLAKMFPISSFIVENIKARQKSKRWWDVCFSPLEVGKNWFYTELDRIAPVETRQGFETKQLRDELGLEKLTNKMSENFHTHCVDSWVLANSLTGGHLIPDNTSVMLLSPIALFRRQLHVQQPVKGGKRRLFGGTRTLGFKRGSLVKHPKYGFVYVGGSKYNGKLSLHCLHTGERIYVYAKPEDLKFLSWNFWRQNWLKEK